MQWKTVLISLVFLFYPRFAFPQDVDKLLMKASVRGNTAGVLSLLADGADVNTTVRGGWTPLYIASQNGYAEIVEALLAKGAGVDIQMIDGYTALIKASHTGHEHCVRALLNHDADTNLRAKDGATG